MARWACAGLVVLLLYLPLVFSQGEATETVYYNSAQNTWFLRNGIHKTDPNAVGWGMWMDNVNSSGWGELYLESSPQFADNQQAYGLGFLEGSLTQARIWQAYQNWVAANSPLTATVLQFCADQLTWIGNQVAANPYDYYWQQVGAVISQVQGLAAGYNFSAPVSQRLPFDRIYILTNAGDLEDLVNLPSNNLRPSASRHASLPFRYSMECSGLIKYDPTNGEIYAGHSTFNGYTYMLRIFKHYTAPFQNPSTHSQTVSFSSRPGDLESKDDFYLTDNGLVVLETSLAEFNHSYYSLLTPASVPCWTRALVANRMANSAEEWMTYFSLYNSGTHNNEWIVLDYKKVTGQGPLQPFTVGLLDQMPGLIEFEDVTFTLLQTQGYVPSYNIPYFPNIFNMTGYAAHNFSYQNDPRARIYRAHQGAVNSTDAMMWLMNSNDWQHDPLSEDNPCNAISARCDLEVQGAFAFGGIDSKVTSRADWLNGNRIHAIGSPTHQTQPVFSFTPKWTSVPHIGMPDIWDFSWQVMTPIKFEG